MEAPGYGRVCERDIHFKRHPSPSNTPLHRFTPSYKPPSVPLQIGALIMELWQRIEEQIMMAATGWLLRKISERYF